MPDISICSFSFHRLLAAGKQDIFQYIEDCKTLGCAYLDPWNAHLPIGEPQGDDPATAVLLSEDDERLLARVKEAAEQAGLPFGCIAVDGAHIYEPEEAARKRHRVKAYQWIEVAGKLGAKQIRIDSGGSEQMTDEQKTIIVEGFRDVIARAKRYDVEIIMENHWGASHVPDNIVAIMEAVPELGLLFDSYNWAPGKQGEGWVKCAKYAKLTHIKTFRFTEDGEELTQNVKAFVDLLKRSGYRGSWGIESVPADGDEIEAARKTIDLIRRYTA